VPFGCWVLDTVRCFDPVLWARTPALRGDDCPSAVPTDKAVRTTANRLRTQSLDVLADFMEEALSIGRGQLPQLAPAVLPQIKGASVLIAFQLHAQVMRGGDELHCGTIRPVDPGGTSRVQGSL
jgi:hypothetical protein